MSVTVRVPAKVNLHLGVGPRRADGFHHLATVFQAVSLFDDVTVEAANTLEVQVTDATTKAPVEGVPTDTSNLAVRAAVALASHLGREPTVRIRIAKNIPVAGGMAGGSADAAATLVACDALWRSHLDASVLHDLAIDLGSDVPFCLIGGTALGTGRGEQLTRVLARGSYHWVFAIADGGLSTPAVYAELDRLRNETLLPESTTPHELVAALRSGEPRRLASLLYNDLERAAVSLKPALRRTLDAGRDAHALAGIVCGSGPTCAFLVADEPAAIALVAALAGSGTCRTVRRAHGPVPGARVVA